MSKPKILINRQDHVTFHNDYLRPQLAQYFDIVDYDPTVNYDSWLYSAMTNGVTQNTWHESLVQSGAGLIYDNLWEYHLAAQKRSCVPSTAHVASCKSYFWINEHYSNIAHGYNQYVPDKNPTHLALLPVRRLTPQRRQLLTALTPVLSQIIYSTVDQGSFLPQDQNETMGSFDRYFDPNWYNNTCFSIVSETMVYPKNDLHVTEKTFKPIAYYHPFVVFGQTGHLAYMRELGFETFENLFDESYDTEENPVTRLKKIVENVMQFEPRDYDHLTWQKLQHNHDLFYNQARVEQEFVTGLVNPILEYAQTR